jgi:hypothetical protein
MVPQWHINMDDKVSIWYLSVYGYDKVHELAGYETYGMMTEYGQDHGMSITTI